METEGKERLEGRRWREAGGRQRYSGNCAALRQWREQVGAVMRVKYAFIPRGEYARRLGANGSSAQRKAGAVRARAPLR